jgi:predicted GIY-YIG superfamily endonuclease
VTNWYVYLLINEKGRTYIGSTTNPARRLRQHNCEIKGGARATRNHGPWSIHCYLSGFQTRSEACRWEKLIKSRGRGKAQREHNFLLVVNNICPSYKNRPLYPIPSGLKLIAYIDTNQGVMCE